MQYFIKKEKYNHEIVMIDVEKIKGYAFSPKNNIDYGLKINSMIVIKPSLITKIVKRKIKSKLDKYLSIIIEEDSSDDDVREALDDIARFKYLVNYKYKFYLEDKYLKLLDKKINLLEQQYENLVSLMPEQELENERSR